jgi:hypothetical protein
MRAAAVSLSHRCLLLLPLLLLLLLLLLPPGQGNGSCCLVRVPLDVPAAAANALSPAHTYIHKSHDFLLPYTPSTTLLLPS